MFNKKNIAEKVNSLIGEGSQRKFADKWEIKEPTLRRYLSLKSDFPIEVLYRIAEKEEKSINYVLGENDTPPIQVNEPSSINRYFEGKIGKYESLLWKFQQIFDFLIEWHGDDSRQIDLFLERMKNDFLVNDPNYRQWTYERDEKAKERLKNMVGEDHKDRTTDIESVG